MEREDLVRGVGGIVLAGGDGPEPLVDEPRLRRAVRAMLDCGLWPVVVVVGKPVDEFRASLAGLPVATVANEALRGGQAGSLRLGLLRVAECAPAALGVVVVECERTVEVDHLCALAAAVQGRRDALAASSEGGRLGLPAFFPAAVFAELREMRAHERCADVLARHADEVQAVARP